jgi:hypothetical protein
MTKEEALKLALEALELHGKQYPHMVKGYCLDAITAIKQALAAQHEPENEPFVSLASVQEPVAYLHQCRKKPELKELSFKKHEPALFAKGYKAIPLADITPPAQPAPVTEGWKQVPVEPTDEMLDAAQAVVTDIYRVDADRVYTAMVQASHGITKGQP